MNASELMWTKVCPAGQQLSISVQIPLTSTSLTVSSPLFHSLCTNHPHMD